ncbi:hypothetical protein MMC19_000244 [Ptychographa xylographoides]|nr:hypothetical protein [Ptychographa xylographoides]
MPTIYQDRLNLSLYDAQYLTGSKAPISDDVIEEVVTGLAHFKVVCKDFGIPSDKIKVIATEATRTAINSEQYLQTLEKATALKVEMLPKEEEGRIGALGIVSSFSNVTGIAMDLGGGSVQLSWITSGKNKGSAEVKSSVSLPYGAAKFRAQVRKAEASGPQAISELHVKLKADITEGMAQLGMPPEIKRVIERDGGIKLFLSGGGFRGWGYMIMATHEISPYPISAINGFEVSKEQFLEAERIMTAADSSTFRISSKRASQVPAVSFLINDLVQALPIITTVHFAQGGVREGLLFSKLSPEVQAQHPLVAATVPHAPQSTDKLLEILKTGIPMPAPRRVFGPKNVDEPVATTDPGPIPVVPRFLYDDYFVLSVIHLLNVHASHPRDIRAAAALRSTTTGILADAHGLTHKDRALIALVLCERWGGEISAGDFDFHRNLQRVVGPRHAWWAKYLGIIAQGLGASYPAGLIREPRLRLEVGFSLFGPDWTIEVVGECWYQLNGWPSWLKTLRKIGKKKGAVDGYRVVIRCSVDEDDVNDY